METLFWQCILLSIGKEKKDIWPNITAAIKGERALSLHNVATNFVRIQRVKIVISNYSTFVLEEGADDWVIRTTKLHNSWKKFTIQQGK